MSETDKDKADNRIEAKIAAEYKKGMCKKREKTTLEKLDLISKILTNEKPNLTRSIKLLETIIKDMNDKKENRNSKRNKYEGI